MVNWHVEFSYFQDIHVRIDLKIDISISIEPMIIKFDKQLHLQQLTPIILTKQVLVMSSRHNHVTN